MNTIELHIQIVERECAAMLVAPSYNHILFDRKMKEIKRLKRLLEPVKQ